MLSEVHYEQKNNEHRRKKLQRIVEAKRETWVYFFKYIKLVFFFPVYRTSSVKE